MNVFSLNDEKHVNFMESIKKQTNIFKNLNKADKINNARPHSKINIQHVVIFKSMTSSPVSVFTVKKKKQPVSSLT